MYRHFRLIALLGIVITGLSACNSLPDHAKLIPDDAIVVAGVNTKEISKKIAWNAIIGSDLLKELQKQHGGGTEISNPEEVGIELGSTSYVYIKTDKRFGKGNRSTALIPLADATKWEAFVKKTFPTATVKQAEGYKEALLAEGMYAGWKNDLLIIMNTFSTPDYEALVQDESADSTDVTADSLLRAEPQTSNTELAAEMHNAFNTAKDKALTNDKRFSGLETAGHDITLWINYDELMDQYAGSHMADLTGGMSFASKFWDNSAMATGFDFESGSIEGDIQYYVSDELKEVSKELGKKNVDKEMIDRLPSDKLGMLVAWHISPQGLKGLLEKLGVMGFINLALMGQEVSADYILEAFTGDMVFAVNDLDIQKQTVALDSVHTDSSSTTTYSTEMTYTYAIKINKKENFNKLLQIAMKDGVIQAAGNNLYTLKGSKTAMIVDGDYFVVSDKEANARAYLAAKGRSGKMPEAVKEVYGNPFGLYVNLQGVMEVVKPGLATTPADSAMIAQSRKLLEHVRFTGGSFKSNSFHYNMSIGFINKEENSLLQLVDFAMRMSEASKQKAMAF